MKKGNYWHGSYEFPNHFLTHSAVSQLNGSDRRGECRMSRRFQDERRTLELRNRGLRGSKRPFRMWWIKVFWRYNTGKRLRSCRIDCLRGHRCSHHSGSENTPKPWPSSQPRGVDDFQFRIIIWSFSRSASNRQCTQ
jgi:hypothetical protein